MKFVFKSLLFITIAFISFEMKAEVTASEKCPYSIENATVMLTLPGMTNLKITSTAMCNQKPFFADRFFDGEVEVWKNKKLLGKFYSRKIAYDMKAMKVSLQNAILMESDLIESSRLKKSTLVMIDLKKGRFNSNTGEFRF